MKKSLSFLWISIIVFLGCSGTKPAILGVTEGRLAPCPDAPHCVSTQSEDDGHKMEPLSYTTSQAEAQEKLLSIRNNYLHVECTSAIFRYVDDVEFYFDDEQQLINFRSSSRIGYYDVGVNRRRMEKIREKFLEN